MPAQFTGSTSEGVKLRTCGGQYVLRRFLTPTRNQEGLKKSSTRSSLRRIVYQGSSISVGTMAIRRTYFLRVGHAISSLSNQIHIGPISTNGDSQKIKRCKFVE